MGRVGLGVYRNRKKECARYIDWCGSFEYVAWAKTRETKPSKGMRTRLGLFLGVGDSGNLGRQCWVGFRPSMEKIEEAHGDRKSQGPSFESNVNIYVEYNVADDQETAVTRHGPPRNLIENMVAKSGCCGLCGSGFPSCCFRHFIFWKFKFLHHGSRCSPHIQLASAAKSHKERPSCL